MTDDVSLEDVSSAIRLVREVCDLWDDPQAWREHLLQGACRLLNGHVGMMVAQSGGDEKTFGRVTPICIVGLPPAMRALVAPAISQLDNRAFDEVSVNLTPEISALYDVFERQGWVTVTRAEIVDDKAYHVSPLYVNFRRHLDCDDYVVSVRMVDAPRRAEAIVVDRPHGAPRFGPREVALLRLLHDEIAPLIGVRLATEDHLCRDGLSRRLGETLSYLLEGRSEKEVAAAMSLGNRTVHDYITMLYDHFKVSSRGELLAYFIRHAPAKRVPAPQAGQIV